MDIQEWNASVCDVCGEGRLECLLYKIAKGAGINVPYSKHLFDALNKGLMSACCSGPVDCVDIMMSKGADKWNWGMEAACMGDHGDLIYLMIQNGANDWNRGMDAACRGGHIEVVTLMVSKGADEWNRGMEAACRGGHIEVVNYMIFHGADDWDRGMVAACANGGPRGHLNCARLMISKGANMEILANTDFLAFYRLYCANSVLHDAMRLRDLIRKQDPLYVLVTYNSDESVNLNKLPMELLRLLKSFLY